MKSMILVIFMKLFCCSRDRFYYRSGWL